jgi:transposase
MSLDNELESYSCQGSMDSKTLIAFLDDFHIRIKKITVIILDNAPIHHSKIFHSKIQQWKNDDLHIFFLPKYSPHLNPIEILWRKIKYQWLPYESIESQEELNNALEEILTRFGNEYKIEFKY